MSPGRLRVLQMLDQRGPMHRHEIGYGFAKAIRPMSSQAAARFAGFICKPLIKDGLVVETCNHNGYHLHMAITAAGRRVVRQETK